MVKATYQMMKFNLSKKQTLEVCGSLGLSSESVILLKLLPEIIEINHNLALTEGNIQIKFDLKLLCTH